MNQSADFVSQFLNLVSFFVGWFESGLVGSLEVYEKDFLMIRFISLKKLNNETTAICFL